MEPRALGVGGPVDSLAAIAAEKGATAAQITIARVLAQVQDIVHLAGARRRDRLRQALEALDVQLTAEGLARIVAAISAGAVAGERYDAQGMNVVNR